MQRVLPYGVDLLAACRTAPDIFPYLLQSAAQGTPQGRYDLLCAEPEPRRLVLHADGRLTGPGADGANGDFLAALDNWWRAERRPQERSTSPFRGGWFLFLGYELAGQVESRLVLPRDGSAPVAVAARVPAVVTRDHHTHTASLLVEDTADPALISALEKMLGTEDGVTTAADSPILSAPLQEEEPYRYLQQVQKARRYILDGDIFQTNLSRLWSTELRDGVQTADIYGRLRSANPAPFAGLAMFDDMAIISSSPERLVRTGGGWVDTRPIAGTRPRGLDVERDTALIKELIEHPKERAEHVMLLDLERNDLGRIAETGSVEVDELMAVESYAHVHHIVSNVRGRMRPEVSPAQVIRAVFPGGTITGCPKVRCMQIIAELEQAPRMAYTGAMGYLNLNGDMDLNILIRTLLRNGSELQFRAGAGIVADSVPELELEETRAKARGLARALGEGA
jgi:anthranilate synthase component 1